MWNKLVVNGYYIAGHILLVMFLLAVAMPLYFVGLNDEYFILYFTVICAVVFPVLDYYYSFVERFVFDQAENVISPEKIDFVLEAQTPGDIINNGFEQILNTFSIRSGKIIIYNRRSDGYTIYEQNGLKKRIVKDAPIERNNPLLKCFTGHDRIIYRKKLNSAVEFEKKISEEMKRLNAETAVPVFYFESFIGILLLGERSLKFSADEVDLLNSFASKISIVFTNSFLWEESLSKGDIKREYDLGLKVQKNFIPSAHGQCANIEYFFHSRKSNGTKYYYDIFDNDGDIRITLFSPLDAATGAFVFSPLLIPLVQSYVRFGYAPAETVARARNILSKKGLINSAVPLFHGSLRDDFSWHRMMFSAPLCYKAENAVFASDNGKDGSVKIEKGDIYLLFDENFMKLAPVYYEDILLILQNSRGKSLPEIGSMINAKMKNESEPILDFICILRAVY